MPAFSGAPKVGTTALLKPDIVTLLSENDEAGVAGISRGNQTYCCLARFHRQCQDTRKYSRLAQKRAAAVWPPLLVFASRPRSSEDAADNLALDKLARLVQVVVLDGAWVDADRVVDRRQQVLRVHRVFQWGRRGLVRLAVDEAAA